MGVSDRWTTRATQFDHSILRAPGLWTNDAPKRTSRDTRSWCPWAPSKGWLYMASSRQKEVISDVQDLYILIFSGPVSTVCTININFLYRTYDSSAVIQRSLDALDNTDDHEEAPEAE